MNGGSPQSVARGPAVPKKWMTQWISGVLESSGGHGMLGACHSPGRHERLPAHAPLRTVRESFPSHGSSLSKAALVRADPLFDKNRCILRRQHKLIGQLGNTRSWPFCAVLHWATAPGRTKRLASLIICSSQFEAVPQALLPFDT